MGKSRIQALNIEARIIMVRGHKVLLNADLARLYGVPVKVLNQAVRRNLDRFPDDFMFQLSWKDLEPLRSQFVTLNRSAGRPARGAHSKYRPLAFTEQGIAMLSSVLRSPQAVQANIAIMRAFVRLREMVVSHKDLSKRLDELESRYDQQFKVVFDAIRQLMAPAQPAARRRIGFL